MPHSPSLPWEQQHRYAILLLVLAGVFMSVLDSTVVTIALPSITADLGVDIALSQWVVSIYPVVETAFIIIFAKLAERTGMAAMYTAGLGMFTVSSLMCGLSASLGQLVLFRVIQGLAAAMMFGISFAICFRVFPHGERGKALGILGSCVAVAMMIGPPVGGFLVAALGWEYIFWINVPVGVVATAAALRVMKLNEKKADRLDLDLVGSVLWVAAVITVMLVLGQVAETGRMDALSVAYLIAFAASLGGFIAWTRKASRPLLDLSVFRIRSFTLGNLSMAMYFITTSVVSIVGPFYYEGSLGYGPMEVGLIFMVLPAVMMVLSPFTGRMYDRGRSSKLLSTYGQLLRAGSLFLLAYAFVSADVVLSLAAFFIMGVGSAVFKSPNEAEVMSALPREKTGVASSVTATVRNMCIGMGLSVGTLLLVLQMGQVDYSAVHGGPLMDELAMAGAVAMAVSGAMSLAGAYMSYKGNPQIRAADRQGS